MPDTAKQSAREFRAKKLNSLRVNAAQASSWQTSVIDLLTEMDREIQRLNAEVYKLKAEKVAG